MNMIFRDKCVRDNCVNYNQISDVDLISIKNILIDNDISIELNDNYCNDWAGFSYYYCKSLNELDEKAISSFVYVVTWFMTSNPIEINPNFKSSMYFKNDKIITELLGIYDCLFSEIDSEVEFCKVLFDRIYNFYLSIPKNFIKKSERLNFVLSYQDLNLFDKVEGNTRSDKIQNLLDCYYSVGK